MSNQISTIQSFSFNDIQVSFSQDAFLNATAIAKQFGKRVQNYLKSEQTQEYITALAEALFGASKQNQLVIIKKGGNGTQGTWLHPKLAIDFARWLNPKFAVWCDMQIEKILKGEYNQAPSIQNHQLYELFADSIKHSMEHVRMLHNVNITAHSDVLHHQKQFTIQHIHAIIQYCQQNNITSKSGKPIFKDGELNFFGGNAIQYGLPTLRLAGLVHL